MVEGGFGFGFGFGLCVTAFCNFSLRHHLECKQLLGVLVGRYVDLAVQSLSQQPLDHEIVDRHLQ
jgi:hypothetical protein